MLQINYLKWGSYIYNINKILIKCYLANYRSSGKKTDFAGIQAATAVNMLSSKTGPEQGLPNPDDQSSATQR